jgi:hypothetical protein
MKYFTPDLVVRYGSDDPATWKAADAEWDERCQRYSAYLNSVKAELPPGLRHVEESYALHDAVVRGMGQRDRSFVIVLQLDAPPHSLLTFTYGLLGDPTIDEGALPPEVRTPEDHVEWQYDEIERVPGDPPSWSQSILFSNGWEVKLHFRDVAVQEMAALIPAPRAGAVPPRLPAVPRSA